MGRKNWLFIGSTKGGQTAAVLISFASTCRRLTVEPWAYLQDVLTRLPTTPTERLDELAPDHWQAAQQAKGAIPSVSDRTDPSPESGSYYRRPSSLPIPQCLVNRRPRPISHAVGRTDTIPGTGLHDAS